MGATILAFEAIALKNVKPRFFRDTLPLWFFSHYKSPLKNPRSRSYSRNKSLGALMGLLHGFTKRFFILFLLATTASRYILHHITYLVCVSEQIKASIQAVQ
jgi:hypothetical protein